MVDDDYEAGDDARLVSDDSNDSDDAIKAEDVFLNVLSRSATDPPNL